MSVRTIGIFAIACVFSACGGLGSKGKSSSGSGDATARDGNHRTTIALSAQMPMDEFETITGTQAAIGDAKRFKLAFKVTVADGKNRRCQSTLRIELNKKTRYQDLDFTVPGEGSRDIDFLLKYSDFSLQTYEQMVDPTVALRLGCKVVGELE